MKSVAVLLTVYNRKDITINCLSQLFKIVETQKEYSFDVYMTDDGCTDGTRESVATYFPKVNIISGDGGLFWNRGMIVAWSAASCIKDYNFYLWLNDDTILFEDSFNILFSDSQLMDYESVIVGATCDFATRSITTYSGYNEQRKRIPVNGKLQECAYFNGNIVLIPSNVFKIIGTNDPVFHHSLGDFDYGLRMLKNGLHSFVSSKFVGMCERHNCLPKWCNPAVSFSQRMKNYFHDLGAAPKDNFIFNKRHYGILYAIRCFSLSFLNFLFPLLFSNRNGIKKQYFTK